MKPLLRLATFVFLFFFCCIAANATQITVASKTINGWSHTDTAPRLRIYVNKPVVTSTSEILQPGSPTSGVFYKEIICSVASGILTIPQFTIDSLTDALTGADAKYSAWFYTSRGQQIVAYRGFESFSVPASPTSTTHAALLQFALANIPHNDNLTYSRTQIDQKFSSVAPLTTKGDLFTFGSGAPARLPVGADGTVPIADSAQALGIRWGTPTGGQWGQIQGTLSNQTDLNTALALKAPLASPNFTGTVTIPSPFTLGATSVTATGTEMNRLAGVTGNVQTQLDARLPLAGGTMTGNLIFSNASPVLAAYTRAGLPAAGTAGRIVRVTDDVRGLWVDTGTAWTPLDREINPALFGAVADGSTNDSTALNAAITAAASSGLPVALDGGKTYGIGAPLDGSIANVRIVAKGGRAIFKKLNAGGTAYILAITSGYYRGWQFENVEFNGNAAVTGGLGGISIALSDSYNITFRNCGFRDLINTLAIYATRGVRFQQCDFYGTLAGVMASGAQDPTANASATYAQALNLADGAEDVIVDGCTFHFCSNGLQQSAATNKPTRGLRVTGSTFRGDWWNSPYKLLYFTPTSYNNGTLVLTVSGGGFTGHFPAGQYYICSIPVAIATGSSFSSVAQGTITTSGSFGSAIVGDSLETSDGRRAEIVGVTSSTSIQIAGWESVDTYEPTTAPALATSWRIHRYYAAGANFTSDTTITLYSEPVNPFTGSRMVTDDGLTPVGKTCRELGKTYYSGVHVNAGAYDLVVFNNRLRGSWADQVSIFNSTGARVSFNKIEYTQDEGVTLTISPHSIVAFNEYRKLGTSAVALSSDYTVISGNTIDTWGVINRNGLGAIDGSGLNLSINGNTAEVAAGGAGSGSAYLVNFNYAASVAGTSISGNTDGGARTATLNTNASNGVFYARDLANAVQGGGAASVFTIQGPVVLKSGSSFSLADPSDTTKRAQFDLSNIGTGQTRSVNVPNANSTTVQADTGASNQFLTAISAQGVISKAQPAFSNLSGAASKAQLPGTTVYTDQANTYSTGAQDFGSATSVKLPTSAGAAPTGNGLIAYDSTANVFSGGHNGTNRIFATRDATETLGNKTLTTPTIASFANANHNHTNSAGGGQLSLSAFSSTTGSGSVVGATSPALVTPNIGAASATSVAVSGTVQVGGAATGLSNGDISAARASNDGVVFLGTDGQRYLRGTNTTFDVHGMSLSVQGLLETTGPASGIQVDRRDNSSAAYTMYSAAGKLTLYSGGDKWSFDTSGHLIAESDNSFDIGASGATRPRTGYFGTSLRSPKFETAASVQWTSGTGSPEGVVTASVGSLYTRTDGGAGTTLYVKESGSGNTGWIAK